MIIIIMHEELDNVSSVLLLSIFHHICQTAEETAALKKQ